MFLSLVIPDRLFNIFTQAPIRFTSAQQTLPKPTAAIQPIRRKKSQSTLPSVDSHQSPHPLEGALKYFEDEGEGKRRAGEEEEGVKGSARVIEGKEEGGEWIKPHRLKGLKRNAHKKPSIAALKRGGYAYR